MAKHPVAQELEREERASRKTAIIIFLVFITALTTFYFYRAEPSVPTDKDSVIASVLSDPPDGVILTSADHKIRLASGRQVKARGLGKIPANYRGNVVVRIERGIITGRNIYLSLIHI